MTRGSGGSGGSGGGNGGGGGGGGGSGDNPKVTHVGYLVDVASWNEPGHVGEDGANLETNPEVRRCRLSSGQ